MLQHLLIDCSFRVKYTCYIAYHIHVRLSQGGFLKAYYTFKLYDDAAQRLIESTFYLVFLSRPPNLLFQVSTVSLPYEQGVSTRHQNQD